MGGGSPKTIQVHARGGGIQDREYIPVLTIFLINFP